MRFDRDKQIFRRSPYHIQEGMYSRDVPHTEFTISHTCRRLQLRLGTRVHQDNTHA